MFTTFFIFGGGILLGSIFRAYLSKISHHFDPVLTVLSYGLIFITSLKIGSNGSNLNNYLNWFLIALIFTIASMSASIFLTKLLLKIFTNNHN